jgi:hypothetical protein
MGLREVSITCLLWVGGGLPYLLLVTCVPQVALLVPELPGTRYGAPRGRRRSEFFAPPPEGVLSF